MKILGVDPGIRGGLAVVAVNDSAAPQLILIALYATGEIDATAA